MVEAGEQKMCSHCERMIDASKLRMHEVQCQRMNVKCLECGVVILKDEKVQHYATEHAPVKCQFCDFTAMKNIFGKHEEVCELRPQTCPYCDQTFKIEILYDHKPMCAAKTRKCDQCTRFVCNRDWAAHVPKGDCQRFCFENEAEKQKFMQKRMEEIEQFNEEERKQREKMALKREAREPPKPTKPVSQPVATNPMVTVKQSQPVIQNLSKPKTSIPTIQPTILGTKPPTKTQKDIDAEIEAADAALIAQMMDEDDNEEMARKMQSETYGGASAFNQPRVDPALRKADSTKIQTLIGGDDDSPYNPYDGGMDVDEDYSQPSHPQPRPFMPVHPVPPVLSRQNQSDAEMEAAIQASLQGNNNMAQWDEMDEDEAFARALQESENFK